MNKMKIPPGINWFRNSVVACSPDNTVIYGAKHDLVIIKDGNVNVIVGAHQNYATAVDINRKWGDPHKYCVSLGEENIINLWDLETLQKKLSNSEFSDIKEQCAGVVFAGDGKVVCASPDGKILLWNIVSNESKIFTNLLERKSQVSCISSCPHAGWLIAFGLNNGHVIVVDLRGNGQVYYKMIGHDKSVLSLAWCPVPVNVFPEKPQNTVKNKEKIQEIPTINNDKITPKTDFLQECLDLKNKILGVETQPEIKISDILNETCSKETSFIDEPQKIVRNREMPTIFDPSDNIFSDLTNEFDPAEIVDEIFNKVFENIPETPLKIEAVESIEDEPRKEFLLASAARDRNIYIWRGGTDGRMQTFFSLPKKKFRQTNLQNSWITLCWIAPNVLLSTSGFGDVIKWPLPKPKDINKQYKLLNKGNSCVLNIVTPRLYASEYDWKDPMDDLKMWTFAMNGTCKNEFFNCRNNETIYNFCTLQSNVNKVATSLVTPNCVALALRDSINLWDLNFTNLKNLKLNSLFHKNINKLSCMAWHPTNELLLACGTEDGKIAIIDINTNTFKIMPMYFRDTIHHMEWGPMDGNLNNFGLYAVAEGILVVYNTAIKEFKMVKTPENAYIYRFAWKPDYSLLLVNTKDAALLIYSSDLNLIQTVYLNDRCLTNIEWHPNAKLNDPKQSSFCNWIAASTVKGFFTYNFESLNDSDKCNQLETYEKPITRLVWSPFDAYKLATTSPNGICHIWDVLKKTILVTINDDVFKSNIEIFWSPFDSDCIILAKSLINVYKISECPVLNDEEIIEMTKIDVKTKKPKKTKKKCNKQILSLISTNDTNVEKQINDMRLLMEKTRIGDLIEGDLDKDDGIRVFGTRNDVCNLLTSIQNAYKNDGKFKTSDFIALLKGNIGDEIREAITENRLTHNLVALAPMVSPKLWQEACESYGRQLAEEADSDPHEVVMYLLACHRVQDAINYLCDTLNFRDALTLAKCRLPDNSEITGKVTEKWAVNCTNDGNFEFAAKCYISIGLYEKAAQVLLKRNNPEILEFAGELVEISGNKELLDLIIHKKNSLLQKETNNECEEKENAVNGNKFKEIDDLTNSDAIGFNQIKQDLNNKNKSLLSRAEIFIKKAESINEEIEEK